MLTFMLVVNLVLAWSGLALTAKTKHPGPGLIAVVALIGANVMATLITVL